MRKRARAVLALSGLTLGLGVLAPVPARADCEDNYSVCLSWAYRDRNRFVQQIRFVLCGIEYVACVTHP